MIPAGVPSTVLVRRPDVAAAGRSMQTAQAAWFPTFTLTGSGGYASPVLADLFKMSMRAWSLGALATLPLQDGGRREAGEANANAELAASLASYREQILVAFRDVEDQLSAVQVRSAQYVSTVGLVRALGGGWE